MYQKSFVHLFVVAAGVGEFFSNCSLEETWNLHENFTEAEESYDDYWELTNLCTPRRSINRSACRTLCPHRLDTHFYDWNQTKTASEHLNVVRSDFQGQVPSKYNLTGNSKWARQQKQDFHKKKLAETTARLFGSRKKMKRLYLIRLNGHQKTRAVHVWCAVRW